VREAIVLFPHKLVLIDDIPGNDARPHFPEIVEKAVFIFYSGDGGGGAGYESGEVAVGDVRELHLLLNPGGQVDDSDGLFFTGGVGLHVNLAGDDEHMASCGGNNKI